MDAPRLTQLVKGGGCARKLPAEELVEVLGALPGMSHPWLSPETGAMDDAAVVYPGESGPGLVLTVDVITPIVDDPADFGRIAAANAISDVYAMGGVPAVALSIVGMPEELGSDVLVAVLRGATEIAAEAGCAIVGGHSLRDSEPKFGLAVVGSVDRGQAWSQKLAQPGQALVLTKPLGAGVLAQAARQGSAVPGALEGAVRWMRTLNRRAAELGRRHGVSAATDVTGFGLLGSLKHLCEASGVAALVNARAVPIMAHALQAARAGHVPGGSRRNARYVAPRLELDAELDEALVVLLSDAQTSGGLLLSLPAQNASALVAELGEGSAVIGELQHGPAGALRVV